MFRRLSLSSPRASAGVPARAAEGNSLAFERGELRVDPRRPVWPKDLARVRTVLPQHLQDAPAPAAASRGSLVVRAKAAPLTVGFAWCMPAAGASGTVLVEETAVLPEYQRRGVGAGLVLESARWMEELGFRCIWIFPISGAGWVERLGFVDSTGTGMYEAEIADVLLGSTPDGPAA